MESVKSILFLEDKYPNLLISNAMPGDDDDPEDGEGDWTDIEDEDFEDMAEDNDELNEIKEENNILDAENDDHLPDEELG